MINLKKVKNHWNIHRQNLLNPAVPSVHINGEAASLETAEAAGESLKYQQEGIKGAQKLHGAPQEIRQTIKLENSMKQPACWLLYLLSDAQPVGCIILSILYALMYDTTAKFLAYLQVVMNIVTI